MVVNAINDARSGRVPQHASGSYDALPDPTSPASGASGSMNEAQALKVLVAIYNELRNQPKNKRCFVVLQDIDDARDLQNRSTAPFTRGDNNK
jgi:hypothetical protein